MGMPWFRMYHEMIDDPKIGTLDNTEFRLWVEILCLACKECNGGDTNLTVTETAWKLRCNVDVTLKKLLSNGLVTFQKRSDGEQTIFVPKWKTRQYQSDSSTQRVRKFRGQDEDETFQ